MRAVFLFAIVSLALAGTSKYDEYFQNYLHAYETLIKDDIYVEHVTNTTSLSAMKVYIKLTLAGTTFHAVVQPHLDLFHPDLLVELHEADARVESSVNIHEHLEGNLIDEPDSRVLLHLKDRLITGSITTATGERYFVEPSHRHIKEPHDFHMISYSVDDVKYNFTQEGKDGGHFCGHDSHKADHDHDGIPEEDFDFSIPQPLTEDQRKEQVYSRRKRAASDLKKCPLALVADNSFYTGISGSDEANAMNFMIGIVQNIDPLYTAQSLSPNADPDFKDYGFQIKKIDIIKTPDTSDAASYKNLIEPAPDVSALLKNFAYGEWSGYCLAHLFSNYDFNGGVLGLAYVAAASINRVGGVCSRTYRDSTGKTKSLNVGLTTSQNYGRVLLSSELVFVTGHEFGHNWGSSHDSDSSAACAPSGNRFMMYPAAVDGSQPNNDKFSPCSKQAINDVLVSKASSCFASAASQFCGNGVVEGSESCDAGINGSNCCSKSCKFTSGSVCEDSNIECCTSCKFDSSSVMCLDTNWANETSKYCVKDYYCNGNGKCLKGANVANTVNYKKECFDQGTCNGQGNCTAFCEANNKISCACEGEADKCKICCKENPSSECKPFTFTTGGAATNQTNGKLCGNGVCNIGVCTIEAADIQEKLWEIVDKIDTNYILKWFKNNIILTIVVITSIFWFPISYFVNVLDDKYDIEDWQIVEAADKTKRGTLLGSTAPADASKNIYPDLRDTMHATSL